VVARDALALTRIGKPQTAKAEWAVLPLVDTHCHLLAGLDDGPRSEVDALAMCRMVYEEGVRHICATAHQNDQYPDVTPDRIRAATERLSICLRAANLPLGVAACAEVMVRPDLEEAWAAGRLLSVGDQGKYLLIEMPHGLVVEVTFLIRRLVKSGVRPILAHPERCPELLENAARIEELIEHGCLIQVSSGHVTDPPRWMGSRKLKTWFKRGLVHLIGSDGHSPRRRPPRMADAYEQIRYWAGDAVADRVCSTNGMLVLQGLPIHAPQPAKRRGWLAALWGRT
jgi:protein-tyrosine phosphatase